MTKLNQIYKCNVCENIVEMIHEGAGILVCCKQNMELITENTEDAATEKHVPLVEKKDGIIKVTVGEVEHPMENKHYIEWIEVFTESDKTYRKYLKPEEKPIAEFYISEKIISVKAYCNLHGLWKS